MSLDLSGKLIKILPEQSGEGRFGKWQKQEFVIETEDKYPKKVCFTIWNDKIDEIKNFKEGEELTVSFNAESREYKERWYTDLKAWRVQKKGDQNQAPPPGDIPPPVSEADIPPEDEGDIPF